MIDVNGTKYALDRKSSYDARMALHNRDHQANAKKLNLSEPVTVTITGRIKTDGKIRADVIALGQ
jgi:hypothetical protein